MQSGFIAAVPVAMRYAGRKDDERTGTAIILFSINFDVHRALENIKDLVDVVGVHAGRGAAAGRGLDTFDDTVSGAAGLVEQRLDQMLL